MIADQTDVLEGYSAFIDVGAFLRISRIRKLQLPWRIFSNVTLSFTTMNARSTNLLQEEWQDTHCPWRFLKRITWMQLQIQSHGPFHILRSTSHYWFGHFAASHCQGIHSWQLDRRSYYVIFCKELCVCVNSKAANRSTLSLHRP